MRANLFQLGNFTLHSGEKSSFKIECDALTHEDWLALADMIATRARCQFGAVYGIPRGGHALADQLQPYATTGKLLVVDDVWTTGASMTPYLDKGYMGYVVFARSLIRDPRCRALFTLDAPPCHYTDKMVEASA